MANNIIGLIQDNGLEHIGRYYSLYRGVVLDNQDPENRDRLFIYIPKVDARLWARSKGTVGGFQWGYKIHTPHIGDIVWVEFENGNLTSPIWEYYTWTMGQKPEDLEGQDTIGMVTPGGHKIILQDQDGLLKINLKEGLELEIDSDHIKLKFGDTTLENDGSVLQLNGGDNKGLINIQDLTDKLNNLVKEVNSLRSSYNSHTHAVTTAGTAVAQAGTAAAIVTPVPSISNFNTQDYEDSKITH